MSCIITPKYLLLVTKVTGTSLRQRVDTNKPFSEFGLKHIHFVFFSLKILKFETAKSAHISRVHGELKVREL